MTLDDNINDPDEGIDLSYLGPKEPLERRAVRWLLEARYWLGFVAGRIGDSNGLWCEYLEYRWYGFRGIRIHIAARANYPYFRNYNLGMFQVQGKSPFDFLVGESDLAISKCAEIEGLIEQFFPGIHRGDTWTICELQEIDDCLGKHGLISICGDIDGKKACSRCEDYREKQRTKEFHGFVYLIGNPERGIYKIGRSQQPRSRYKAFRTKLPFRVDVLHQIGADDMQKAEKLLHSWFRDKNSHGEWFELTPKEAAFICGLTSFEKGKFINEKELEVERHSTVEEINGSDQEH